MQKLFLCVLCVCFIKVLLEFIVISGKAYQYNLI